MSVRTLDRGRPDRAHLIAAGILAGAAATWATFAGRMEPPAVGLALSVPWVLLWLLHRPSRALWLILILVPFAPTTVAGGISRSINFVLPAMLVGLWLVHLARRPTPVRLLPRSLTVWFASFLTWTAFAACFSTSPGWGWWQVAVYLIHLSVLVALWNFWTRRMVEIAVLLVGVGTLVVAAFAIHQVLTLGWTSVLFGRALGPSRLTSLYHNPGPLGLMMCYGLVVAMPLLLLRLRDPRTLRNLVVTGGLLLAIAALLVALLASFSRASYLYALAALVTLALAYRRLRWIALGGVIVAGLGLLLVPIPTWLYFGLRLSAGASYRDQLWKAGWDMMADHPFTGIGPGMGMFELHRPYYVETVASRGLEVTQAGAAHNIVLTKGAELGIPGLVLMILFHVLFLRLVPRALRAFRGGDWLAGTAAAGAVGITVRGLFETGGTLYTGHLDDTLMGSLFVLVLFGLNRRGRWGPDYGEPGEEEPSAERSR